MNASAIDGIPGRILKLNYLVPLSSADLCCQGPWFEGGSPPLTQPPLISTFNLPTRGSRKIWQPHEDTRLTDLVERLGLPTTLAGWRTIAEHFRGLTAKQCRARWVNHLAPGVQRTAWTTEEDKRLLALQASQGNNWSSILKHFPGRTYTSVKNR
jgi:hypothetical protein